MIRDLSFAQTIWPLGSDAGQSSAQSRLIRHAGSIAAMSPWLLVGRFRLQCGNVEANQTEDD